MPTLEKGLAAPERVILAVDTSDWGEACDLMELAKESGAWVVKLGLELSSATSWGACSEMAAEAGLEWVADAKLDDIDATTQKALKNIITKDHPPVGVTIHANSGIKSMRAAQGVAAEAGVTMFAVTHLTSVDEAETKNTYRFRRNTLVRRRLDDAVVAGIGGLVCSGRELRGVVQKRPETAAMFSMIPGTRSAGAATHDQRNVITPEQAIIDGADLLVIGRQVTQAADPAEAFSAVVTEIASGLAVVETRGVA